MARSSSFVDVAVIGAGPYGLSLAAHLGARGVEYRIFGETMRSWKSNMPPGMLLKSYPWASCLSDPSSEFSVKSFCTERALPYHDVMMPLPLDRFIEYGGSMIPEEAIVFVSALIAGADLVKGGWDYRESGSSLFRTVRPCRPRAQVAIGESVVVFGVGGVGLNVVQFAAMVGANPVIAIDRLDNKLEMARRFGATHTINSDTAKDVAGAIRELVGADGVDKVVETTGVKHLIELGYDLTARKGRCILVGVPREKVEIYTLPLHFDKVLKGSEGGQCQPARDIPRLVRLAEAGKISYEGIVTDEFSLDQINGALDLMRSGKSGRILLNIG
jgi:hypothetical protein